MPPTQRQGKEPVAHDPTTQTSLTKSKMISYCRNRRPGSLLSSDKNPGVLDLKITRD